MALRKTWERQQDRFLTTAQIASALGVAKRTLLNWINTGKVTAPAKTTKKGFYRWTLADLENVRAILRESE